MQIQLCFDATYTQATGARLNNGGSHHGVYHCLARSTLQCRNRGIESDLPVLPNKGCLRTRLAKEDVLCFLYV